MINTETAKNTPPISELIMTIMPFLVWASEERAMHGGVTADAALEAFRHVLGWDKERFEALCKIFSQEN